MRRSQAPSIRYTASASGNDKPAETSQGSTSNDERSTDNIVNLLFSGAALDKVENKNEEIITSPEEPKSPLKPVQISTVVKTFSVVYGKQSKKKHKTWEGDGTLEVGVKFLTLKDEDGKVLGTVPCSKYKDLEEGSRLYVGSKEVEIIELTVQRPALEKRQASPVQRSVKKPKLSSGGKSFVVPLLNANKRSDEDGLLLPEPSAQHQWYFNKEGKSVTPVCVEPFLARQLRQHQKFGVTFLYECVMGFRDNNFTGAILADEMGLGKTLQCIALVWTLLRQGPYGRPAMRRTLVVTPSSLTASWSAEFAKWLGRERIRPFVVDQKNRASDFVPTIHSVMIISYEMFLRCYDDVSRHNFNLLICDEGHRLKNSSIRTTQLLSQLPCTSRILLTGTPIQNDLQEFHALVNFVNPNALGSAAEFRRQFEEPILQSRQPSADEETQAMGEERASDLNRKTSPFMLRRTHEVLDKYLPSKQEVVVFCKAAPFQRAVYNSVVSSLESSCGLLGAGDGPAHLAAICSLKKVCNHPALVVRQDGEEGDQGGVSAAALSSFPGLAELTSTEHSGKLSLVVNLLTAVRREAPRDKTVLVSNSTRTLDLLAEACRLLGVSSCRLDGATPPQHRPRIVDRFNSPSGPEAVFLLSAKAGGVGLNLTGASRLVLYDSDWNPATDLQAMSRIWRDGQKRSVCIYRLLTSGTIEEKIYQRQMSKQGLCEGTVDPHNARSIKLSQEELRDLFSECPEVEEGCGTHALLCPCSGRGLVPLEDPRPLTEDRPCQLTLPGTGMDGRLKTNELLHWEHHGPPFDDQLLADLRLSSCRDFISYIFRNSTN